MNKSSEYLSSSGNGMETSFNKGNEKMLSSAKNTEKLHKRDLDEHDMRVTLKETLCPLRCLPVFVLAGIVIMFV